jgi:hypothetical protein
MDESSQPDDLAQLRDMFPDWHIEARWTVAGTGPDSRYLLASRAGVTSRGGLLRISPLRSGGRPAPADVNRAWIGASKKLNGPAPLGCLAGQPGRSRHLESAATRCWSRLLRRRPSKYASASTCQETS